MRERTNKPPGRYLLLIYGLKNTWIMAQNLMLYKSVLSKIVNINALEFVQVSIYVATIKAVEVGTA
jgi:hypothetical protein